MSQPHGVTIEREEGHIALTGTAPFCSSLDIVTRKLFEQILEDEENHLDMFEGWLGDL